MLSRNVKAMSRRVFHLLTDDESLFARFRDFAQPWAMHRLQAAQSLASLPPDEVVLIDLASTGLPEARDASWQMHLIKHKIGFLSPAPNDDTGIFWLDRGASGYCHSFAAGSTILQMLDVISSGELWVGRSLMARLLKNIGRASTASADAWKMPLTEREREVASLAALGESNQNIAVALGITERTVKSHLTAIFEKLGVVDRLQLALKVHGIR